MKPITVYQELNIAGQKLIVGLREDMSVVDAVGKHISFIKVPECDVALNERDIAEAILRKIKLN